MSTAAATTTGHTDCTSITMRCDVPYQVPPVISCTVNQATRTASTTTTIADPRRSHSGTDGENASPSGQSE